MDYSTELLLSFRVICAALLGALIGLEREIHGKDAGIRTFATVAMGACLFGIISFSVLEAHDPTRIAAQVVTGIGFLGAGVILRGRTHVTGLTTAAMLWVSAAVGLAIAFNMYILGTLTALISALLLFTPHLRTQLKAESRQHNSILMHKNGKQA